MERPSVRYPWFPDPDPNCSNNISNSITKPNYLRLQIQFCSTLTCDCEFANENGRWKLMSWQEQPQSYGVTSFMTVVRAWTLLWTWDRLALKKNWCRPFHQWKCAPLNTVLNSLRSKAHLSKEWASSRTKTMRQTRMAWSSTTAHEQTRGPKLMAHYQRRIEKCAASLVDMSVDENSPVWSREKKKSMRP